MSNPNPAVLITKTLITTAIALGSCVGVAAPASADPSLANASPSPFSTLSCSCRETAPAGSLALEEEIDRGIQQGRSA